MQSNQACLYMLLGPVYTYQGNLTALNIMELHVQFAGGIAREQVDLYTGVYEDKDEQAWLKEMWVKHGVANYLHLRYCPAFTVTGSKVHTIPVIPTMMKDRKGKSTLDVVLQQATPEQKQIVRLFMPYVNIRTAALELEIQWSNLQAVYEKTREGTIVPYAQPNEEIYEYQPLLYPTLYIIGSCAEDNKTKFQDPCYAVTYDGKVEPVQNRAECTGICTLYNIFESDSRWKVNVKLTSDIYIAGLLRNHAHAHSGRAISFIDGTIARNYKAAFQETTKDASTIAAQTLFNKAESVYRLLSYNAPMMQYADEAAISSVLYCNTNERRAISRDCEALCMGIKSLMSSLPVQIPKNIRCLTLGISPTSTVQLYCDVKEDILANKTWLPSIQFEAKEQLQSWQCFCNMVAYTNLKSIIDATKSKALYVDLRTPQLMYDDTAPLVLDVNAETVKWNMGNQPASVMLITTAPSYQTSLVMQKPKLQLKYKVNKGTKFTGAQYDRRNAWTAVYIEHPEKPAQISMDMSELKNGRHLVSFFDDVALLHNCGANIKSAHDCSVLQSLFQDEAKNKGAIVPGETAWEYMATAHITPRPAYAQAVVQAMIKISAMTCIELSSTMNLTVLATSTVSQLVIKAPAIQANSGLSHRVDIKANVQRLAIVGAFKGDVYLWGEIGTIECATQVAQGLTLHVKRGTAEELRKRSVESGKTVDIHSISGRGYGNLDACTKYLHGTSFGMMRPSVFGARLLCICETTCLTRDSSYLLESINGQPMKIVEDLL